MDFDIRDAYRKTLKDPSDPIATFRYRSLCLRAERNDLLKFQAGDIVLVTEVESPWVRGSWEGRVISAHEGGDAYVQPIDESALTYRVTPSREYFAKGLYLTREDMENSRIVRIPMP